MIRNHSHSGKRSAFTLVELLVVILIIAILVGLIGSAAMKALAKIPEVSTRNEITQLGISLEAFKQDYNITDQPPSSLILYENVAIYNTAAALPGSSLTYAFLQKAFGKNLGPTDWNGDGQIDGPGGNATLPWVLEGEQCLMFYVGGIPSAAGPQGFSTNNIKPSYGSMPQLGEVMGKRKGPYFTFDMTRLKAFNGFYVYIDAWQSKQNLTLYAAFGGTPYAYFSSGGINNRYKLVVDPILCASPPPIPVPPGFPGDCPHIAAFPYLITGTPQCMNPNGYQIISAGRDGVFGTVGWNPANGATLQGADDQSNFSGSILGAGQQ